MERLKSRTFWIGVAGIGYFVLGAVTGNIDWNTAGDGIWKIVLGYMSVQGAKDIIRPKVAP